MSSTRHAQAGSDLRQERWASSPEHEHGLKANLVARRCAALASPEERALIWFVQLLANRPEGMRGLARDLMQISPRLPELWGDEYRLAPELMQLCLNPECAFLVGSTLRKALGDYQANWIADNAPAVTTEVGATVCAGLAYALDQRCLVVIDGLARIGKTFAAQHWCAQHPGHVRYVQVPSTNDDLSFFTAIAKALGLTIESNPKAKNLRPRIEDTLQAGDLMLVLDEAHYAWPGHAYRNVRPARICWLLTALVNYDIPVSLIVTPQFFRSQKMCERKIGWACEQLVGRIGDYIKLPESLSMSDLRAVARSLLPEGDAKSIEALALYADSSQKYLAAIDHAVRKARHVAKQRGRDKVIQADVRAAIEGSVLPSEVALSRALSGEAARKPRGTIATPGRPVSQDTGDGSDSTPVTSGGFGRRQVNLVSLRAALAAHAD